MTTNKCVVGSPSEKSLEKDSLNSTSVTHASGPFSDDSPGRSSRDDPFVVKGGMKLSATAPVFMPTGNGNIMMSIKEPAKLPFAHSPLSSQQVQETISVHGRNCLYLGSCYDIGRHHSKFCWAPLCSFRPWCCWYVSF